MHLKSLTLRGFKSFASSTTMRFEPGVNCVVGPNGSGKSNVVDALAWVMGEQGVKNLRGGSMADVIFAGTAKRPALGRAEVALTIDNSDGVLPIEYSEVTISRTLFRSGGSEYAINGTSCRLLDIQDLLSDTGMGKEMHVIIGQGRLDAVLTASPEDRRSFIEEASGVLKHRKRKEKALRKMESMAGSLTRIEDLTAELRRQLGPLARQAEAARKANIIQADVRDARARLLADDLAQQHARLSTQATNEKQIATERERNAEQVQVVRGRVLELEGLVGRLQPELALLNEQWEKLGTLQERFRSLSQLAAERQRSLAAGDQTRYHGERPEDIRERAKRSLTQEEALRNEVESAADRLSEAVAEREELEQTERQLERDVVELNRIVADQRESAARLTGQLNSERTRIESLDSELERVVATGNMAAERAAEAARDCEELEAAIAQHSGPDDSMRQAHEQLAFQIEETRQELARARRARQEQGEALASWKAKAETLALSLEPADATMWVMDSRHPSLRLLRDHLSVSAGWESAVEAALAGAVAGVAAESLDEAVDLLRAVREENTGRIEITIADGAGEASAGDDDASYDGRPAWEAAASRTARILNEIVPDSQQAVAALDVVAVADPMRATIERILCDTVLTVDLLSARTLLQAGIRRVATVAGDVLTASRAQGGEASPASLLARQHAYKEAEAEADGAAEKLHECGAEVAAKERALEEMESRFQELGADLTARDSQLAALSAQLGVVRRSVQSSREEQARGQARVERIRAERARHAKELADLERQQSASTGDPEELARRLSGRQEEIREAHEATRVARQRETEARLKLRTSEERLRAVAGKAEALERNAQAVEERIERARRAAERRALSQTIAHTVEEDAQQALSAARAIRSDIGEKRQDMESRRTIHDRDLAAARQELEELQATGRKLADSGHQHELLQAELRLRYEQLSAQAIDTLGIQAGDLIDEYGPHVPIPTEKGERPFVRAEQEQRLAKSERALGRLGKINPLALEEHAALEERQKYLSDQLMDLRKSRDDLLRIVRDIDQHVEEVLGSALRDVSEWFETVFAKLFPGGQGRMVLTDPDNPLTTGVDLEARPPGKRVKRLSLLSGGERSLTAIAFLVAIFMARPSPFYVMDEVEAALDDVNLSRLLDTFRDLQENSQLLVVTHQKRTMEIADTLYGVTMRDDGVSHVISQRMRDIAPA
ncbi:chromosome segregation protein SMC [Actinomycetaceae bacterium L2_0104]